MGKNQAEEFANGLISFIIKEWLVVTSGVGVILTSLYTKHIPHYSIEELQVLFILFVLFITVKGLQQSGLILKIARNIETGKVIPLKLVATTFFLSMLVTNDIALIVMVPLTISLNINRKAILVILEALAANAGSALTPFGNPQNLFIYWFYNIQPTTFIAKIAPFCLIFMVILFLASLLIKTQTELTETAPQQTHKKAYIYVTLLITVLLTILHVLPVWVGILVVTFALTFDRKALSIDYALLLTFFFFFGIADNLKTMLASDISHSEHIFLLSALASQVMSNVPAALLFAKFTSNWEALLWGVSVGGFGSLFGSLANLIAYKIYITHERSDSTAMFTAKFLILSYTAFFVAIGLYFLLKQLQWL
ncbi:SLC13 family permease [Celerinatantimonas diazotrophica]|uniref:YbiR family transporter n=1 Tax=Celerinatantimonas diazotrophica TaxID=412034 RepID=A0A4R1JLU5_9GAMM|nr:SLC13 family permease [Celerinatantimonas diazotrophica]TCK52013.1 YbiR family transporter [Celerinatantimonas diazotrophica]CAG9296284.1 hypothetical protein CEDIAZO_01432 [Celerinatantimonas diazotrophica]